MKFSLVLATIERVREVEWFLRSLQSQTIRDFELVVVDQNPDERLKEPIAAYREAFPILHLRGLPGLSRARNLGLRHAKGEVISFPDDDCLYPSDLLERVADKLRAHLDWHGITGRAVGPGGGPSIGRFDRRGGFLNRANVWIRGISFTIFLRSEVVREVGPFDESLGAGTPWGSGEETDYLIRALRKGYRIRYCPEVTVLHPDKCLDPERARRYGRGMGRVLRKHGYPLWAVSYHLARALGGAVLYAATGNPRRSRSHLEVFRGRWEGWRKGS